MRRVYRVLRESDDERDQRRLGEWIAMKGGSATVRDVQRRFKRFKTSENAEEALQALAAAGLGAWEAVAAGEAGGRPTSRFVLTELVTGDTTSKTPYPPAVLSTPVTDTDDDWEAP